VTMSFSPRNHDQNILVTTHSRSNSQANRSRNQHAVSAAPRCSGSRASSLPRARAVRRPYDACQRAAVPRLVRPSLRQGNEQMSEQTQHDTQFRAHRQATAHDNATQQQKRRRTVYGVRARGQPPKQRAIAIRIRATQIAAKALATAQKVTFTRRTRCPAIEKL